MDPSPMAQSLKVERQEISDTTNDDGENVNSFKSEYLTDFEPVALLGKGAFGMVFEAKKKFDDRNYAIKRIALSNSQDSRERVMREVKALAKLEHSNIVRYYNAWFEYPPSGWQEEHDQQWINKPGCSADSLSESQTESQTETIDVSQTNQSSVDNACKALELKSLSLDLNKKPNTRKSTEMFLYIQMQLCKKSSLKEWLKQRTPSIKNPRNPFTEMVIFEQILDALEYVHSQELIHRDLKPSNIFFGYDDKIKIGDFGLVTTMTDDCDTAQALAAENENVSLKNKVHTACVGTHLYMSPEQMNGQNYDYKVDIYSLGIIFFELFTPFPTEMERIETLSKLREPNSPKNFIYSSNWYLSCFKELMNNLLLMMLNENPNERPTVSQIKDSRLLRIHKGQTDTLKYHHPKVNFLLEK